MNIFLKEKLFSVDEVRDNCKFLIKHGKIIDLKNRIHIYVYQTRVFENVRYDGVLSIGYLNDRFKKVPIVNVHRNSPTEAFRNYSGASCSIYNTLEDAVSALGSLHEAYIKRIQELERQMQATLKKGRPLLEEVEVYSKTHPECFL